MADREWHLQPAAEGTLRRFLSNLLDHTPEARAYAERLHAVCGVRLRDIIDHVATDDAGCATFSAAGWRPTTDALVHSEGRFPSIVEGEHTTIWLRVESIETFAAAIGKPIEIEGAPYSAYRRALVFQEKGGGLGVVERNGHIGFHLPDESPALIRAGRLHLQSFRARRRQFDKVEAGLDHTEMLVDAAVSELGPHRACALWLTAEREYWMSRCSAGRIQKARQDAAGIGWANIDHHTYDGSRAHFRRTVAILERLGYELREMLYAGEMAGWGSQILEQPAIGSTIFADVDLAPEEVDIDFAHEPLPPLDRHRRAGLLSVLHGESILEAGLNHVAALFDQQALRRQLEGEGLRMMQPFSNMPHLYQELTEGDRAAVDPTRVDRLEQQGHIGAQEAEKVRLSGAILSHLENIERNDGYKGFNKPGIDGVLRKLDPRASAEAA